MTDKDTGGTSPKKTDAFGRFEQFRKKHPIVMNLVYILATGVVLTWLMLVFLDSWTLHGEYREVPQVKGVSYGAAEQMLRGENFGVEVIDSVFESGYGPGTVVEQTPHAGSNVKPGRTVYLTIAAFSPKMVTVPDFYNVSSRQGQSMFEALGLRSVRVIEVPSEYKGLVLGVKYNGVELSPGARIPVSASVTIEVGAGVSDATDSLDLLIEEAINGDALDME